MPERTQQEATDLETRGEGRAETSIASRQERGERREFNRDQEVQEIEGWRRTIRGAGDDTPPDAQAAKDKLRPGTVKKISRGAGWGFFGFFAFVGTIFASIKAVGEGLYRAMTGKEKKEKPVQKIREFR